MKQTFCPPHPLRDGIPKNPSLLDVYVIIGMHCQNFNSVGQRFGLCVVFQSVCQSRYPYIYIDILDLTRDFVRARIMYLFSWKYVVMRLMKSFLSKGLNFTVDNFFTSIYLAKELQKKGNPKVHEKFPRRTV